MSRPAPSAVRRCGTLTYAGATHHKPPAAHRTKVRISIGVATAPWT
nr:hypothetical protein [Streptomyces sp. ND04-05B]